MTRSRLTFQTYLQQDKSNNLNEAEEVTLD